jgi:hypothetical protein
MMIGYQDSGLILRISTLILFPNHFEPEILINLIFFSLSGINSRNIIASFFANVTFNRWSGLLL